MWDKLAAPSRVALRETALCKQEISSNSALQHPTPPTLANPPLGTIFSIRDGSKLKNGISQRRKHRIRPILLDNCWTNSRQSTAPGCKPQYSADAVGVGQGNHVIDVQVAGNSDYRA